jgi:hypothetical protein
MKTSLRNLLLVLSCVGVASAADLSSTGDWTENVNASHLTAGAGSNLPAAFQSVSGTTVLSIANAPGNWRVKARRGSGNWNGNLILWVKRTSDGSGSGTISGGDTFVELGATDAEIFSGTEARGNISLQYKLTGLTSGVAPDAYTSSIIFTIQ